MKSTLIPGFVLLLIVAIFIPDVSSQTGNESFHRPEVQISDYRIEATVTPDEHWIEAAAVITFQAKESTDHVVLDISENLSIRKVLNEDGIELEFEQSAIGPEMLSVLFSNPLEKLTDTRIRIEYVGGFDRDRFSRMYSRNESGAYIGEEGSYLMYDSKWIPGSGFLADKATTTLEVTVPLGITVIGPGRLENVITKGINETFIWHADTPISPASIVAGRYFQREFGFNGFTIECFSGASEPELMEKVALTASEILKYYQDTYGPSASGDRYRLVVVDDRLSKHHGMLGTIFVTREELEQPASSTLQLARRIAYQWWSETVGVENPLDLWLEDGMAYYSAAGYIVSKQGEDSWKDQINLLAILALKFENTSSVRKGFELGYRSERYESVVAGKGAWILNMLRGLMGESEFKELTKRYIQSCKGGKGTTAAFQNLAETLYGESLNWYFNEWVETTGIPSLASDYIVYKTLDGFRVTGTINQDRDLFRMPLEVAVVGEDEENLVSVDLNGRSTPFDITAFSRPKRIVLDPHNKLLQNSTDLQTEVQLALGNDRKKEGDFVEAIRAYESALKLSPQKSLVHFSLAEVYYEQFNYQSAADSFRNALNGDLDPKWIEVWCYIYLGKIYDVLGQRQRALAEYTKAVNTKDDTNGAQAEAKKWIETPFTRSSTILVE